MSSLGLKMNSNKGLGWPFGMEVLGDTIRCQHTFKILVYLVT